MNLRHKTLINLHVNTNEHVGTITVSTNNIEKIRKSSWIENGLFKYRKCLPKQSDEIRYNKEWY